MLPNSITCVRQRPAPGRPRCPHYQDIRTFFRTACEYDLNPRDAVGMRDAMRRYFGFRIGSRSELTATHWELATAGIMAGELSW